MLFYFSFKTEKQVQKKFVQTKLVDRMFSSSPLSFAAVVENGFFNFHLGRLGVLM